MRFDEPRSRPLWITEGDEIYGHNLTASEYDAELDDTPHRPLTLILGGTCRRVPAATGTRPGADAGSVTPLHRPRPAAPSTPSRGSGGPDFPTAA